MPRHPNALKLGRPGQEQCGVDVLGRPDQGPEWAGVQCKLKTEGQLTRREIAAEVGKARSFNSRLSDYVVATTARRDGKVQDWAREITAEQLQEGSFPVTVWAWDDLCERLGDYPDLVRRYFPELTLPEAPPSDRSGVVASHLERLWAEAWPARLLAVGAGGEREEVPLVKVYTALDVTETVGIDLRGKAGKVTTNPPFASAGRAIAGDRFPELPGELAYLCRRLEWERERHREEEKKRPGRREAVSRRLTALEAAATFRRLVLLGAPGSGKSTFARFLALSLAGQRLGRREANLARLNAEPDHPERPPELVPWRHQAPLPVFAELRRFVRRRILASAGYCSEPQCGAPPTLGRRIIRPQTL